MDLQFNNRGFDNADCLSRVKDGDAPAIFDLAARFDRCVFNLINRITQNIEVAEAVLIEAFLSVAEFANDRPDDSNIERTLIQIAVRKALLRAPQDSIFPDETHSDAQLMIYRDILPWRWDSLDPLTPKDLAQTLDRALQHLAPVDRAIFVLKDVEAMSIEEAAGVVCLPIPVVKRRLLRARLQVTAELSKRFAQGFDSKI